MNDYLLLMHDDAPDREQAESGEQWGSYLAVLRASGNFDGGSSIGPGMLFRKGLATLVVKGKLSGYLRIRARSLEEASGFMAGNPVFEAGGTVEVRELVKD